MQVLRYGEGNEYRAHWDWFFHADGITNGGNRAATVLTYLSDVEEGGETVRARGASAGQSVLWLSARQAQGRTDAAVAGLEQRGGQLGCWCWMLWGVAHA
jgi:hypothetical protein